jgi:amphi-Trp domain-containing protein
MSTSSLLSEYDKYIGFRTVNGVWYPRESDSSRIIIKKLIESCRGGAFTDGHYVEYDTIRDARLSPSAAYGKKMTEETLFEVEKRASRSEVAAYLRTVADRLDEGGTLTLEAGDDAITVETPREVEFEVAVEREGPASGDGELSVELEFEWPEGGTGADSLSID